jgi:general stress protein YciG
MAEQNDDTGNRGFASIPEDKQREIAKKGGESVPAEKRSFSRDPNLASEAGRKGGEQSGSRGGQQNGQRQEGSAEAGRAKDRNAQDSGRPESNPRGGSGNFAENREASEAGRNGGSR